MNKNALNIPNALSVLRIIIVPVFAVLYLGAETAADFLLSGAVLAFSGITDMLDGKIARKYNMITDLGKVLDPLADKLTQGTVCVCLAVRHPSLSLLFGILIIKEILIFAGGILVYRKHEFVVSPNIFGKIYTAVFFVVMAVIVAFPAAEAVLKYVLWALLACNIYTFIKYVGDFININRKSKPGEVK
ncbi:MAG: CDP-alcohol phosphatidyltransferase family protein [Oscillospiraceae bacterium]|nr:CDP-alcohol phosphatidyltransferase family protein [Oscillospiraceae bacterium]